MLDTAHYADGLPLTPSIRVIIIVPPRRLPPLLLRPLTSFLILSLELCRLFTGSGLIISIIWPHGIVRRDVHALARILLCGVKLLLCLRVSTAEHAAYTAGVAFPNRFAVPARTFGVWFTVGALVSFGCPSKGVIELRLRDLVVVVNELFRYVAGVVHIVWRR